MLAQNESLRPPTPQAAIAVQEVLATSHLYPDPDWAALRQAIAEVHKIDAKRILCGAGSMELIHGLISAYTDPDNAILSTEYAYAFIRTMAKRTQARIDLAPESQCTVSVDAILTALRPDTRVVFVANPGNPTGTCIANSELRRLRQQLPASVLLMVDEAYGEFADHRLDTPLFPLTDNTNTVVLRTLSKAYGLAGMRVGWGLFPLTVAEQVQKLLNPNNISVLSQAMATAAVQDQPYMRETVAITQAIRQTFTAQMRELGLLVPDSYTNFVLVSFASPVLAESAEQYLRHRGIVVRAMTGYGLGHCLRVGIGTAASMQALKNTLVDWRNQ